MNASHDSEALQYYAAEGESDIGVLMNTNFL